MWVIVSTAIHLRCGLLHLQPYTYVKTNDESQNDKQNTWRYGK
jgi:hypothetical protein